MPKLNLPNVNTVRIDGKTYYYHRPTKTRLPDDIASAEFLARLNELNAQLERPDQLPLGDGQPAPLVPIKPGSWRALFAEIKQHTAWLDLKPRTQELYQTHITHIENRWGDLPVGRTQREDCIAMQDDIARRHQVTRTVDGVKQRVWVTHKRKADTCMDVLSWAFSFALDRASRYGRLQYNPAFRMKRLHKKGIGYPRWPEEMIETALSQADPHLRLLLMVLLYTGQRISDVIAMRWTQYDGTGIQVTTFKTKRQLWIPCHPALKAALDAAWAENKAKETPATHILLAAHNSQPWLIDWAKHSITNFMRSIDHPGYSAHGLRKSACARLVESGCDEREGAETVGMSVQMFQHYTKEVRQQQVATGAIAKLSKFDQRSG